LDKNLFIPLGDADIVFISNNDYILGIVKSKGKSFLLETDKEEIVLGTGNDDILAVSSLANDKKMKIIMSSALYSLREFSFPLIILKKGHPASKRLKLVFGCGEKIILDSCIDAGTHPDQHLLCSTEDLTGLCILARKDGIEIIDPMDRKIEIERMSFKLTL